MTTLLSVPRHAIALGRKEIARKTSTDPPEAREITIATEISNNDAHTKVVGPFYAGMTFELDELLDDKRLLATSSGFATHYHLAVVDRIMLIANEQRKRYLERIRSGRKESVIKSAMGPKQVLKERKKDWE